MGSFTTLFTIFRLLHFSSFTISEPFVYFSYCSTDEYTEGGIYGDNLNKLLDSLSSSSENGAGFYNLSAGRYPNQVNGITLCRGDLPPFKCTDCIKSSADKIFRSCPNQTEAFMYYDGCILRFSDSDILGGVYQGETPSYYVWNHDNVSNLLTP